MCVRVVCVYSSAVLPPACSRYSARSAIISPLRDYLMPFIYVISPIDIFRLSLAFALHIHAVFRLIFSTPTPAALLLSSPPPIGFHASIDLWCLMFLYFAAADWWLFDACHFYVLRYAVYDVWLPFALLCLRLLMHAQAADDISFHYIASRLLHYFHYAFLSPFLHLRFRFDYFSFRLDAASLLFFFSLILLFHSFTPYFHAIAIPTLILTLARSR